MTINTSSVKSIMSNTKPRGVSKYMLEEVYFSDICFEDADKRAKGQIVSSVGPHNAYFYKGKYHFQYPALWYNQTTNNKAIGLRRIETRPKSGNFTLVFGVERKVYGGGSSTAYKRSWLINIHFTPEDDIEAIMSYIVREMNKHIDKQLAGTYFGKGSPANDKDDFMHVGYEYNETTSTARFFVNKFKSTADYPSRYDFTITLKAQVNKSDFFKVFGERQTDTFEGESITFDNVWNRRFLFVHASFVSGTSFNYLGRSGEFYTKPSKMYHFLGNSQEFTFELSLDGMHTIDWVPGMSFIIELCYIYDDRSYQAE